MKVLVISTVQTHPTTSGSGKYINEYCELMKSLGFDVHFLLVRYHVFTKKQRCKTEEGVDCSKKAWKDNFYLYRVPIFQRLIEYCIYKYRIYFQNSYCRVDDHYPLGLSSYVKKINKIHNFDACIVNYFWLTKLFEYIKFPRMGFMAHDSFTYNNLRNSVHSLLNLLPNDEAKALQRCPYIFAIQNEEAIFFKRLAPLSKILISYCYLKYEQQPVASNHNLLLLSSNFYLNVNGVNWFVESILPSIVKEFPDVKLIIGGNLCLNLSKYINHPYIDLQGYIENVSEFYNQGDVSINPTFQGTGLKIKTFEALSFDKVTMVHPHSLNGVYNPSEAPIFSSENPNDWIDFLKKIWLSDSTKEILAIKQRNKKYIDSMNAFISSQFDSFLKSE